MKLAPKTAKRLEIIPKDKKKLCSTFDTHIAMVYEFSSLMPYVINDNLIYFMTCHKLLQYWYR